MIEINGIYKNFGAKQALRDVSFNVAEGEIMGFLGPNGAGKTTTMNILTGYLSATAGTARIDGVDVLEKPLVAKSKIGFLPEQPPLYMDMTVEEYLKFVCEIKEVRRKSQKAHLDDLYNLVKITDVRHRLIRNLSKGYKQRVGVAQALVGMLKDEIQSSRKSMLGAAMMKDAFQSFKARMDYEEQGGAPLLGVNGAVVKAHGSSTARAFKNAIGQAYRMVKTGMVAEIEKGIAEIAQAEKKEENA